jgi:hypothetical protein
MASQLKDNASRKKAFPCDTSLAITFRPTGGWCQPTYLSTALQQLNNLILTPKNGESRDFGPYSGQIPTFSNSQSYLSLLLPDNNVWTHKPHAADTDCAIHAQRPVM